MPPKKGEGRDTSQFTVVAGVPEMHAEWTRLATGLKKGNLAAADRILANKLARAVSHLQQNPFHPGLQSHEIDALSLRYGTKVFESYLENNTPSAGRIFWVYGPKRMFITLIGMEPHPKDSKRGYARVLLSALPPLTDKK